MAQSYGWGIRLRDGVWEERLLRDLAFVHGMILVMSGVALALAFFVSGGPIAVVAVSASTVAGIATGIPLGSRHARSLEKWNGGPPRPRRSPIELLFIPVWMLATAAFGVSGVDDVLRVSAQAIAAGYAGLVIGWPLGVVRHEGVTGRRIWLREVVRGSAYVIGPRGTVTVAVEPVA